LSVSEVYRAQELIYELKIGEIMTRRLITVTPETTMRELKNLLRDNRISGTPVLVGDALVGIVSIEDLILSLERGDLDSPVGQHMTTQVYTACEDESVVQALNKFAQTGVGRLPVVNRNGQLVGIITPDDITRGVLKALQQSYHEEEVRRYRASHIFEDIASDKTSLILRYDVPVRDFRRAGRASSQLKHTLSRLGIDPRIIRRVAIAAYEAEMNIVIHSLAGGNLVVEVTPEWIAVLAVDLGPGIADVEKALQPGFSTAPDWIREMGFGAGMGLNNIQACADEMYLDSIPTKGTRLEAVIHLHPVEGKVPDEAVPDRRSAVADC
jgi:CBS domain-containing protein/anti-sigma regulatory factor (Ser/Thr protein kinase)